MAAPFGWSCPKELFNTKDVLESGTPIIGNSFEVSENGKYSVGVQDNEGRREVETIKIDNIDKEPLQRLKAFLQYTIQETKRLS